ncbi:hypothetical protein ABE187_14955 [Bacillus cabrialesii]|uniref:hypothetical protein n=1 Tax=Bacillus cabrialesii TaxID=2487276 RepID=UPI003D232326
MSSQNNALKLSVDSKSLKMYKKAKKKALKSKTRWEIHPLLTISISDLNWYVDTIKQLELENLQLKQQIES